MLRRSEPGYANIGAERTARHQEKRRKFVPGVFSSFNPGRAEFCDPCFSVSELFSLRVLKSGSTQSEPAQEPSRKLVIDEGYDSLGTIEV